MHVPFNYLVTNKYIYRGICLTYYNLVEKSGLINKDTSAQWWAHVSLGYCAVAKVEQHGIYRITMVRHNRVLVANV
jgi:hypothetical protein